MEFLILLYENEQRFSKGYPQSEMAEYQAFGKEFSGAIKGGNALQPTSTAATVRVRDGKQLSTDGPFAKQRNSSADFIWWKPKIAPRQLQWQRKFRPRDSDPSKCVPS